MTVTPAERQGSNWKEDSDGWITVGPGGGDVVQIMQERAKMAAARPRMLPTDDVESDSEDDDVEEGNEGDDDEEQEARNNKLTVEEMVEASVVAKEGAAREVS